MQLSKISQLLLIEKPVFKVLLGPVIFGELLAEVRVGVVFSVLLSLLLAYLCLFLRVADYLVEELPQVL